MFKYALVRPPAHSITEGLSSSNLGKPHYAVALEQHKKYIEILTELGLQVQVLPENVMYPDSTFIEDVALCTKHCAIVTRPGAESRMGETEGIRNTLENYYDQIEEIAHPGTLEAGDVMMVGDHFYIGISGRTNNEGADQAIKILNKYGFTGSKIALGKLLHLKSGLSCLENNIMLVSGEFIDHEEFIKFSRIIIDPEESYAANSLWINGTVLVPSGFPNTKNKIEDAGYKTIITDVSEFRKVDGGLSCLSLRF